MGDRDWNRRRGYLGPAAAWPRVRAATPERSGRQRPRRFWVSGLLLLALAGCGHPDAPPPAIKIGVLANMAEADQQTMKATELAVSMVNAAGGLEAGGRRRPVELLFEDTRLAPGEAIAGARRLIQQNVVALVGPSRSRDAIAAGGVTENARLPMVCPASTHPQTTAGRSYVFRVSFTDVLQGEALGRFARELGDSAAVLFDVASAYNRDLAEVFRQAFEAAGGRLVAFESYTTGESDFRPQLERIRDARPQVLLLPNYPEEIPVQVRQARSLGIDATLLGGDSWNLLPFADHPELEGAFCVVHWHADQAEGEREIERFIADYRGAYGRDPTDHAALAYDAIGLLLDAVTRAGDDPDAIRDALAAIEGYPGVTGAITYQGRGGDPAKRLIIGRVTGGELAFFEAVEDPALGSLKKP